MKKVFSVLEDDGHCFLCGPKNPQGLNIGWEVNGKETSAEFIPEKAHQGWKGVVHGGILAAILDEAMTRLIWKRVGAAVTAEMTVRYLAPAEIGQKLFIHGTVVDDSKRLIFARAEIKKEDGTVVAQAEGKTLRL